MKLCLDIKLFHERQSDAYMEEAVRRCAHHIVYTHFGAWNFSESEDGEVVQDPAPASAVRSTTARIVRALHASATTAISYPSTACRFWSITGSPESRPSIAPRSWRCGT